MTFVKQTSLKKYILDLIIFHVIFLPPFNKRIAPTRILLIIQAIIFDIELNNIILLIFLYLFSGGDGK